MKKLLLTLILIGFTAVFASVPNLIPIQGTLTDAEGNIVDGDVDITFTLYDAEEDGTKLWTEERTDFTVEKGYISVYLGEKVPLTAAKIAGKAEVWLEIGFNEETMPRIRLGAVPFALEANSALSVGNLTAESMDKMFTAACDSGYYLRGWDSNNMPICDEDLSGSAGGYSAGAGIVISEQNAISVDPNLYVSGYGISLASGEISVNTSEVADKGHTHANYYEKVTDPTDSNLVKFTQVEENGATVMKLADTGVTENNGTLTVGALTTSGTVSAGAVSTGTATASGQVSAGSVSTGAITASGNISANGNITMGTNSYLKLYSDGQHIEGISSTRANLGTCTAAERGMMKIKRGHHYAVWSGDYLCICMQDNADFVWKCLR